MNSPKRLSAEQITAMTAAASHRVIAAKSPSEIHVTSIIQLAVNEVLFYEKNPRRHDNPKYDEIKESIRARGLESALYITKRPGSLQYMLARGGKTRLKALQELAQEEPQKWGKLDFHEIPWVSESEILAAHLVENTGREAMCFWDLAEGIATLRDQIALETGKLISVRNLPAMLKARGIEVSVAVVWAAEFSLEYLQALGSWKPHLGFDHVQTTLRPKFNSMQDLWCLDSSRHGEDFKAVLDQAVAACVAEHTQYSPEILLSAVVSAVATALGVSTQGMLQAMHSHQANAIRTLHEFHLIAEAPTSPGEGASPEDPSTQDQVPTTGSDDLPASNRNGNPSGPASGPAPKPVLSDAARQNLNRLMGSGASRATDVPGIPGVSVARGLIPRAPKSASAPTGQESLHGGPLTQAELDLLEKEGNKGLAKKVLWSELMSFGDVAGITHLIHEALSPHMPYTFYVELPEPGRLGDSPEDIAVQAWWFLAAISGQGDGHILPALVGPDAPVCAFKETGPESFAHAILVREALLDAVATRLGGQEIPGFNLLMMLITRRDHPLHRYAIALLDACANWNAALGSRS
jgi:ParB family protein of integrating conjugative element (PFGI_1 class)